VVQRLLKQSTMVTLPMTLSDLAGHSSLQAFSSGIFPIFVVRHTVSVHLQSFFSFSVGDSKLCLSYTCKQDEKSVEICKGAPNSPTDLRR